MERKIGEKFELRPGVWVECVARAGCDFCFCNKYGDCMLVGVCAQEYRSDHNGVIFVRCEPHATEEKKENAELTKREKIALAVLQSMIESHRPLTIENNAKNQVEAAFQFADEFLEKAGE